MRDPNDTTPPAVSFDPLLDGTTMTAATAIVGTVQDSNLDSWVLAEAPIGSSSFVPIASGNSPVSSSAMVVLDAATMVNGFYRLRLSATDIAGRTSTAEVVVEADTSTKSDEYQRAETDLVVQLGGATIDLVRAYDSLDSGQSGSFGYGWRLANRDMQLQTDVPPTGSEALGIYNAFADGTRLYLSLAGTAGASASPSPRRRTPRRASPGTPRPTWPTRACLTP